MKLSIVATMYHSAPFLEEFHQRCVETAERITDDFEIVLVNDGSPDDSQQVAESICDRDSRVRILELSRNFGHHKAIMAGLASARGEHVFLLDCDLEEHPEWLEEFYEQLVDDDVDVVYGVQGARKGDWWERVSGDLFYRIFNMLSECPLPRNLVTARLMTRDYVDALSRHEDHEVFLGGLFAITGFRQRPRVVTKGSKGTSTYNFARKARLMVNAITSFSSAPLVSIFYLGVAIVLLASGGIIAAVFHRLLQGSPVSGWTSLIVSTWLLGGVIIFCQGVLGIYLSRVFSEVKRRPNVIVRGEYGLNATTQLYSAPKAHRRVG